MSRRRSDLAVVQKSGDVVRLQPALPVRTLTPKQEAFARTYVETGNASEAYRRCYDVSQDAKPETITVNAAQLLANTNVSLRVAEIEAECLALTQLTMARLISEGLKILASANAKGDDRAAIAALATLEKLHARLAPELSISKGRNIAEMTDEWLAQCIAQSEASIDRPPDESRDEWMLRQAARKRRGSPTRICWRWPLVGETRLSGCLNRHVPPRQRGGRRTKPARGS